MKYQENNAKNMCCFYASNWHLLVMISSYLKNNKGILIKTILEENMENDINELIQKNIISKEDKSELLNINWNISKIENNNELDLFMKEITKTDKETAIILKGSEENVIKDKIRINNWINNNKDLVKRKINIICCIDILKLNKNMELIMQDYKYMLNTRGEHEIK